MSGRLPAHVELSGLIRRAESLGGNATVIGRGDRDAGSILIVLAERGISRGILERSLLADMRYGWRYRTVSEIEQKQPVDQLIKGRRKADPDIWVLELDIPAAERFAAEMVRDG